MIVRTNQAPVAPMETSTTQTGTSIDLNSIISLMMVIMVIKVMSSAMVQGYAQKGGKYLEKGAEWVGGKIKKYV